MKKVMDDMNIFRKDLRVRQEVSDEIQTSIYLIKYELQTSIETNTSCKKGQEKLFWLNGDENKQLPTMNTMEKQTTKMNTASENITYLVDNKTFLCEYNKFYPLTARRGKWISEIRIDILKKSFSMTHRNTSLQREETIYQVRN